MYIKARVHTSAKKECVEVVKKNELRIFTRAKAEQGRANIRVREIVARHYGVPEGVVHLVKGHKSPSKILSIQEKRV